MNYSEFVRTYPLLALRLIEWAAQRIAQTYEHIESELRVRIAKQENNKDLMGYVLSTTKYRSITEEFSCNYYDIPRDIFDSVALNDPTYRQMSVDLAAAKFSLRGLMRVDTTPNQQDYALAQLQVKLYIETLQNPSEDVYEFWGSELSAREKHYLYMLDPLWYDENGQLPEFIEWIDLASSWYDCIGEYQVLTEPARAHYKLKDRLIGHLSRNSHNVDCLNAYVTMFVDIDLEPDNLQMSTKAYPWGKANVLESEIFIKIAKIARDFELKFACYRTAAGYRLIEMSREWEPTSLESATVLEKLGCDRRYQRLCETQGTYRARLEPKPWRKGTDAEKTVCHFLRLIGEAPNCSISEKIKEIHDSHCLGRGELA